MNFFSHISRNLLSSILFAFFNPPSFYILLVPEDKFCNFIKIISIER